MKTPLLGQFKIVQTNLPDATKEELLNDISPRYFRVGLSEPIRQAGREFSIVVVPFRMTPAAELEQCGIGVLCETEAEAKESMEMLSQSAKETIVVVQTAGLGIVGKVKNVRFTIREQSVRSFVDKKGKKKWLALERDIDKATGEVSVIRRNEASNEPDATRLAKNWLHEYQAERKLHTDAMAKARVIPPTPPRCIPLTKSDLEDDLPTAKWTALKRQWPHSFELFDRRKADSKVKISDQECQDAYLLDLVEQGYDPKTDKVRGDLQFIGALHTAAKKFARRGRSKITDVAVYLIAFNWELGWCYLADAEIAKKLEAILSTKFSPGQVKQFRSRTLGLVAKHLPGPSFKCL